MEYVYTVRCSRDVSHTVSEVRVTVREVFTEAFDGIVFDGPADAFLNFCQQPESDE